MTRKKLHKITRRFGVVLALTALAVPAAASAHPAGGNGYSGPTRTAFVPTDPGQARVAVDRVAPANFVLRRSGPVDPGPRLSPVTTNVNDGSNFNWSDALIGAGATAAIMTLALGGALVARRQGRLGYR
jgi:hypothetical protein